MYFITLTSKNVNVLDKKTYIGYYSPKAANTHGCVYYTTPNNRTVACTCVLSVDTDPDYYNWDDKICVGEVIDYVGEDYIHKEYIRKNFSSLGFTTW